MKAQPSRLRIGCAAAGFVVLLIAILARATQLTLVDDETLRQMARRQQQQRIALHGDRGRIADRNGHPLAMTVEAASVYVRPSEFEGKREEIARLAQALRLSADGVEEKLSKAAKFVWLKRLVPPSEQAAVEQLGLRGVGMEIGSRRYYPHGDLASQILGFTGVDGDGLEGIERRYDAELRGAVEAVVVGRDARGRRMLTGGVRRPPPRRGARVELTIDASLQHIAETELDRGVEEFGAAGGIAVVLDPKTGEILALAQSPRFDPNNLDSSLSDRWRNRAVEDSFEPGSTMKPFVAAAALEASLLAPNDDVFCEEGRYRIGGRWIHDHEPQGWLTLAEVIQHSSNIGIAKIAERLGQNRVAGTLRAFGFGERSGIDLPAEVPGLFPRQESWRPIRLANVSFGQGISVTALQLARAFAVLANGGIVMRPYAVRRVVGADGQVLAENRPSVERRAVSQRTAHTVTEFLRLVVDAGTGTNARIPGIAVAGKTGTAQQVDPETRTYSPRDRTASFAGFAPADDARVAVAVVVDRPRKARYGGIVSAPIFRRITEAALEGMGVQLVVPQPPAAPRPAVQAVALRRESPAGGIPNVVGLGMREAATRLARLGLQPIIEGWGVVVRQEPPPGSELPFGSTVHLTFGSSLE